MKTYSDLQDKTPEVEDLLKRVSDEVHSIAPGAKVVLYGSRARGDATSLSDWDFLILVDKPLDRSLVAELKDRLYDLELETDAVLSSIVRTQQEWQSARYSVLPFKHMVDQEGVLL